MLSVILIIVLSFFQCSKLNSLKKKLFMSFTHNVSIVGYFLFLF